MAENTTLRQQRMQQHLYQTFVKLVKKKRFHELSVTDIVTEAKYNRSTFYKHFKDKYDLAQSLLSTTLKGLEQTSLVPYFQKRKVYTSELTHRSFHIVTIFMSIVTILKIYIEQFNFETLNDTSVNM